MRCPRCDRWPDEGQELCRFCIAEDQAPSESEGSNCPGVHDQLHVDAMDVAADSAKTAGARKHEEAVSSKFSIEPSMGTGTGSEVIDVVREGSDTMPEGDDGDGSTAQGTADEPAGEPTPRDSEITSAPPSNRKWAKFRMGRKANAPQLLGAILDGPSGRFGKMNVQLLSNDRKTTFQKVKYLSDCIGDPFEQLSLDAKLSELLAASTSKIANEAHVIFDAISFEKIAQLGSLRAAALIELTGEDANEEVDDLFAYPKETLRQRCARDLLSAQRARDKGAAQMEGDIGRLVALYRQDKLSKATGIPGRLVSGVTELSEGAPFHDLLADLCEVMPAYCATRSIACAPKWYKEFVRPSTTNDFDRKASFPSVIQKRYPDLKYVTEWCTDKRSCVRACGLEDSTANINALKLFCNSAAGSGKPVLDTFLDKTGLEEAPEWVLGYRDNLREAARRDTEHNAEVARILEKRGLMESDVTNKTHYICNARDERADFDESVSAARSIVDVVGLESDGCPCMPLNGEMPSEQWREQVLD